LSFSGSIDDATLLAVINIKKTTLNSYISVFISEKTRPDGTSDGI